MAQDGVRCANQGPSLHHQLGDPHGNFRWLKKSIFCVFSGKVLPCGSEKPTSEKVARLQKSGLGF
jgi:hypothetical protein